MQNFVRRENLWRFRKLRRQTKQCVVSSSSLLLKRNVGRFCKDAIGYRC